MMEIDKTARKSLIACILLFSKNPEETVDELAKYFDHINKWDRRIAWIFGLIIGFAIGYFVGGLQPQ